MPNRVPAGLGTTIFADMSELAPEPDRFARAMGDGRGNRCRPSPGLPDPRRAIAEHQRRLHGLEYDPENDVVVTTGAAEALAAALPGLLEPVDEVTALAALPRFLRRPRRHGRSCPPPGRPAPAGVRSSDRPRRNRAGPSHPAHGLLLLNSPQTLQKAVTRLKALFCGPVPSSVIPLSGGRAQSARIRGGS